MGRSTHHRVPRIVLWHLDTYLADITDSSPLDDEHQSLLTAELPGDLKQLGDTMTRLRHRAVPQRIVSDFPSDHVVTSLRRCGVAHHFDGTLASADVSSFVAELECAAGDGNLSSGIGTGSGPTLVTVGDRIPTWAASEKFSTFWVGGSSVATRGTSSTDDDPSLIDAKDLAALLGLSDGEQELDDLEFERLYGAFARRTPAAVKRFMAGFSGSWYIASGWALEAFSGVSRAHHDIDVCIYRNDLGAFQRHCARRYDLWSAAAGALKPLRVGDGEDALLPGCGQLWVRANARAQWEFDVLLCPGDGAEWICKRDESIRLGADEAWWSSGGVRYLAPQAALLMKAQSDRPQDRADLAAALPKMTGAQRCWLSESLARLHPGHDWLTTLD